MGIGAQGSNRVHSLKPESPTSQSRAASLWQVVYLSRSLSATTQADCSNRGYHPYGMGTAKNPYQQLDRKVRLGALNPEA